MSKNLSVVSSNIGLNASENRYLNTTMSQQRPHSFPKTKSEEENSKVSMGTTQPGSSNKKRKQCAHTNVCLVGSVEICADCAREIKQHQSHEQEWRWYGDDGKNDEDQSRTSGSVSRKSSDNKGIKKDLAQYNLPANVVQRADEIYQQVTQNVIKRSNLRKGIVFACVFEACMELDCPQIPEVLQEKFDNLDHTHITKGRMYLRLNGIKTNRQHINATHYVPKILDDLNLKPELFEPIFDIYEQVRNRSVVLNRANPQSVSAGLVYYYLRKRKNVDFTNVKFGKLVDLSEITISKISNEIERVINNCSLPVNQE
jgi:transcription initiation factor TFIIIB Brf1 subunit/transcription initiation factor TFIIB